jgi:hypothetical protein
MTAILLLEPRAKSELTEDRVECPPLRRFPLKNLPADSRQMPNFSEKVGHLWRYVLF